MEELIGKVQQLAEVIGPNPYLQAAIIAAAFILAGKVADLDHIQHHRAYCTQIH